MSRPKINITVLKQILFKYQIDQMKFLLFFISLIFHFQKA